MKLKFKSGKVVRIYFADIMFFWFFLYPTTVLTFIAYEKRDLWLGLLIILFLAMLLYNYFYLLRPEGVKRIEEKEAKREHG